MKKLYTLFLGLTISATAFAQTFSSTGTQLIRDNEYHTLQIAVTGLPKQPSTPHSAFVPCV